MLQIVTLAIICVLSLTRSHAAEPAKVLFGFADPAALRGWQVEDDVVMGGRSQGQLARSADGHLIFRGKVSLENDGGFSSIQNNFDPIEVSKYQHAVIRLKGDGKDYRFIVESDPNARHYYTSPNSRPIATGRKSGFPCAKCIPCAAATGSTSPLTRPKPYPRSAS